MKKTTTFFLVSILLLTFTISTTLHATPVADANGPYEANEGEEVAFDAGGSFDTNGSSLLYRWDFDNDGSWETDWTSDPVSTYIWNDDWNGIAVLEISNGTTTDTDTASVIINNVMPVAIIDLVTAPTPLMPGDIVSFNGSTFDPGILDTHMFEWDFGDDTNASGPNVDHVYTASGTYFVTLNVTDDDGGSDQTTYLLSVLMPATVDIHPDTLNLDSNGRWITCYIELPEGYNASDLNISSISLGSLIPAETWPSNVEDYDGDGVLELMLKFDRETVQEYISDTLGVTGDNVNLTVTGEVAGQIFQGSDTININNNNSSKNQNANANNVQNGNTNNKNKNTPNNSNNNKFKTKNSNE